MEWPVQLEAEMVCFEEVMDYFGQEQVPEGEGRY